MLWGSSRPRVPDRNCYRFYGLPQASVYPATLVTHSSGSNAMCHIELDERITDLTRTAIILLAPRSRWPWKVAVPCGVCRNPLVDCRTSPVQLQGRVLHHRNEQESRAILQ